MAYSPDLVIADPPSEREAGASAESACVNECVNECVNGYATRMALLHFCPWHVLAKTQSCGKWD